MSLTYQRKLQIFSSILAATVLVACGAQGNPGALPAVNLARPLASSRTFHFTHGVQKFRVPQGVTQLTITAFGAPRRRALRFKVRASGRARRENQRDV